MASEYLKWKYRDVTPDVPSVMTPQQKAANWWHYHRIHLLVLLLLCLAVLDIAQGIFSSQKNLPDYQFAYVASAPLDAETIETMENAFASLGEDCNGDGRVIATIHSYANIPASADSDQARYAYAAKTLLSADLETCDSYFFILDDPETFHIQYDILAGGDGALAGPSSYQAYAWKKAPVLSALLPDFPMADRLFLARRGFWENRVCQHKEACDKLWANLTEGAEP